MLYCLPIFIYSSLPNLYLTGSEANYGTSNIIPNSLKFDFLAFKNLTKLVLVEIDCSPEKVTSLGPIRGTLRHLEVHKCGLVSPRDILLCDSKNSADDIDEEVAKLTLSDKPVGNSKEVRIWSLVLCSDGSEYLASNKILTVNIE